MTAPGELIADRYRLGAQIGGGGMGAVWLADDLRLDRQVAVKQVLAAPGVDQSAARQQRKRAMREGRIAARLSHPHAISIYDVALEDGEPWLVMEYLPSRSLAAVLSDARELRIDQVAQIGAQLADALTAVHAAGIVHRDVKPANVLIGQGDQIEGLVKITDFGISHASGDVTLTQTGMITGTPAYLAPEVAQGNEPGPAADVFALGATLYTCLEGHPPFGTGENALQQLHRAAAGTIEPPLRCGALTHLLLRMLSADPGRRPTMRQVRDELAELAAGNDGDTTAVLALPTDIDPNGSVPGSAPTTFLSPAAADPPSTDEPTPEAQLPPHLADPAGAPPPPRRGAAPPLHLRPDGTGDRRRFPAGIVLAAAAVAVILGLALWATRGDGGGEPAAVGPSTSVSQTTAVAGDGETATAGGSGAGQTSPSAAPVVTEAAPAESNTDPVTTSAPEPADKGGTQEGQKGSVARFLTEYHKAATEDPAAAYERAGPKLRASIGEEAFARFWAQFDDVRISDVQVEAGGHRALANVELSYSDGTRQVERHRFDLIEQDGDLLLDQDRFVEMIRSRS